MKSKKVLSICLCFLLAMSISVTSLAAELPNVTQNEQTGITETTEAEEEETQEEAQTTEPETSPEEQPDSEVVEGANPETTDSNQPEEKTEEESAVMEDTATKSIDDSVWTVEDFIYTDMSQTLNGCDYTRQFTIKGRAVAGLSDYGKEKLKTNKNLVIPATDDSGVTLVGVADAAFKEHGLESVEFPTGMMVDYDDTVTNVVTRRGNFIIGAGAFQKNNLTNVYLPEGVIAVMSSAFKSNQLTSVTFPHTIWWIENQSFATNKLPQVNFPKTCDFQLQIKAMAFAQNDIKSVRLPDYTEAVDKRVFYYNPGVEEIPADAPEKEKDFGGLVYMYTDNANLMNMERIHHIGRTAETQKSWHQKLIVGENPEGTATWDVKDFVIEGTTINGLSESGIEKRKTIRDLMLPDRNEKGEYITKIADSTGNYGLFGAANEGFNSVELPSQIQRIGNKAFANVELKAIAFPNSLKEIGVAAFQMNKLTSVILPDSLRKLGGGAFGSNPTIERISLSKSLTEIPAGAFGCSDAKNWMDKLTALTIPNSVVKIGNNAFAGNNITDIVIPSSVKEIGTYAFSTKNYLTAKSTLTLPEGLETIGNRAFRNKVIESVELPSTVKALPKLVFEKEYSDDTEAVITKVFVTNESQYSDTKNFPKSDFHKVYLKSDAVWTAEDFIYGKLIEDESTIYPADMQEKLTIDCWAVTGLSDAGKEKLEVNKNMVIPSEDPDGKAINGVGPSALKNLGIVSLTLPANVMADYSGSWNTEIKERGNFIIASSAFYGNQLTSLEIPEGVIKIGGNAFGKNQLVNVTLPKTLGWIGNQGFANNKIASLAFSDAGDFKLNADAMSFANNQIQSVRLPDRCEKIDKTAFLLNTGKEKVTVGTAAEKKSGLVYMYTDNPELKKEGLIAHTENIGKKSNVQKLIVGEMPNEEKPWNIDDFTVTDTTVTGLTESGQKKVGIGEEEGTNPNIIIPNQTKDGKDITAIGDGVVGEGTFGTNAKSIKLPAKLQTIGKFAFSSSKFTQIKLPETLVEIQQSAFQGSQLQSIVIPNSVTKIGQGAFSNSTKLQEVVLSGTLTAIDNSVFTMTAIKEIVIPEGVKTIGTRAFAGTGITSVSLPTTLEKIGDNAFDNHQLTEAVIPSNVKSIGKYAFRVVQEGLSATLGNLIIEGSLEEIGSQAFAKSNLTSVVIPSSLTKLNKTAFKGGVNGDVILYTSDKNQLDEKTGYYPVGAGSHKVVYDVLANTGWEYSDFTYDKGTVTGWSEAGHVKRLANHKLVLPEVNPDTNDQIIAVADGAFKIPDGEWEQLKDSIYSPNGMETVRLPEKLQTIGKNAFQYNSLTEVEFGSSLVSIGESAFHGNRLTSVSLPDNITEVKSGAFATNDITEIKLSKGVTVIQQGVFSMNIRLDQIDIPDTVTEIGDMAFAGARLSSLSIPKSVTKIGRKAFHLHHLTELTIPGNVKEIGDSAFEGTFKAITLKKLTIEEGVEKIGSLAFKEGYLESVTLPESITSMAKDAFYGNAGTNNDHVVVVKTTNPFHALFEASDSYKLNVGVEWKLDRFTYDGTTLTGLTEKGKAYLFGVGLTKAAGGYTTEVVLPDKNPEGEYIKAIADNAYKGLALTKITLPTKLEKIGNQSFADNAVITVALPDTMVELAGDAFKNNAVVVNLTAKEEVVERLKDVELEGAELTVKEEPEEKPEEKPEDKPEDKPGDNDNPGENGGNGDNNNGSGQKPDTTPTKAVQTGDTAPILPIAATAGAALLAVLIVLTKRKKQG